ncbi:outer membrane protein [Sphingomonas sp. CJ99]
MRHFLLAASALAAIASPAMAQEVEEKPFDGVYIGGSFGYSVQNNDNQESVTFDRNLDGQYGDTIVNAGGVNVFPGFCAGRPNGNSLNTGCVGDKDDIEYYGRIGIDKQMGNIVVGVVGEFGKSEASDSVTAFSSTPANYQFTRQLDWNGAVRGRVGYAANTTLFYGTGGVTYGKIKNSFTSTNTLNAYEGRGDSEEWGWQAGGGVEQKLGRNFSIGLEYLFTRFDDDDYVVRASRGQAAANHPFVLGNANGTDFARTNNRFDFHSLRATAAFRF